MNDITHAREVRSAKARVMADLKDGSRSLRETLRRPPECLKSCTVYEVIIAGFNMGPTGSEKVLSDCGVSPLTKIHECPAHVRGMIVNQLPDRAR